MVPLDKESVVQTAQVILAYLSNPANSTPNDMLEGIVSGKSLMRGLVTGSLVVFGVEGKADGQTGEAGKVPSEPKKPKARASKKIKKKPHRSKLLNGSPPHDKLELKPYG